MVMKLRKILRFMESILYRQRISETFKNINREHVLNAGIGKLSHANNNRVERLNGTQRKDQSAVRMQETHFTIAEGQRIKYSFETTYDFRK
jgi:hypothetical protein